MIYFSGELGSLIRRDSAKFERNLWTFLLKFFYQILMRCYFQLHWNFKLVFSVACREILRFPIVFWFSNTFWEFIIRKCSFFCCNYFNVLYFAFLYNSLSIWSLGFLFFLKSLSLVFIFSKTSPSNHFWEFALTLLVIKGAILSTTIIIF